MSDASALSPAGSKLLSPTLVIDREGRRVLLYDQSGTIVLDSSQPRIGKATLHLFGAGIVGEQIWRPGVIDSHAARYDPHQLADFWETKARGALCLFAVWPNGRFVITPDPLGAAPVYFHEGESLFIASASIPSLQSIASKHKKRLTQSIGFALEVGLLGNGGIFESSLDDVRRTKPFDYLCGDVDGWCTCDYSIATAAFDFETPLDDLARDYREDVQSALSAVLDDSQSSRKVMNLTGGLDSRTLLASLVDLERSHELDFYTSGAEGTQDVDTADNLSRVLGLRRTNHAGLGGTSIELGPGESPKYAMQRTGGLSRQGPTGLEHGDEAIVLGGLYGMLTHSNIANRTNAYKRSDFDIWEMARGMYPGPAFASFTPERSLFSQDFQADMIERLAEQISKAEERVPFDDFVMDYLFLNGRNRFHSGIIQASTSPFAARIDPLYARSALRLGIATPALLRGTNVHQFDAIKTWAPRLLSLPFDSEKFTGLIREIRRIPSPVEFSALPTRPGYARPESSIARLGASVPGDPRRSENLAAARQINAPYWQVRLYSDEREVVAAMLNDSSLGLSRYLNMRGVRWVVQNALRNRAYLRVFVDLVASLDWIAKSSQGSVR